MPNRNQCPVCWWSVRCHDGVVVAHDRESLGLSEPCPGSGKPAVAATAPAA